MAKEKEQDKQQDTKPQEELTEWQKRNIKFLKKKEAEELEKKKQQEKMRLERNPYAASQKQAEDDEDKDSKEKVADKANEKKKESSEFSEIVESDQPKPKKVKKPKEKKERSPLQKAIRHALPVLLGAVLVLAISIFLVSPLSKKKVITVEGGNRATQEDVLSASGISSSDYFFSLILNRSSYMHNILKNDKLIREAKMTYHFPNKFTIKIKEYNIVAYAQTDDGYQPILENGTRLGVVSSQDLPDNFLTINLSSEKEIEQLIKAFSKLDKSLVQQIQIVSSADSSTTSDLLNLEMHDGNTVRVPLSELDEKLPYYDKIKQNLTENSIVDMEVGIYTTTSTIESEAAAEKEKAQNEANADESQMESTDESTELTESNDTESQSEVSQEASATSTETDAVSDTSSTQQ